MVDRIFTLLETPRLLLRRFREADLERLMQYRNDPEVAKYQSWDFIPLEQAREFIEDEKDAEPGTPGEWFQFAIESKEDGTLIGDCGLYANYEDPRQGEIGYTLAREHQHRGYASEAVTCVLNYAFNALNMHRIIAVTDCENSASIRLLERLGFRREGHFVKNVWFKGKWADEYEYAMLQEEWRGGRPAEGNINISTQS